jgi:hypothetical protein
MPIQRHPASIHLEFSPQVRLINYTREYLSNFYDCILNDPDTTSRVALTAHELLENALKYSTDGMAIVDIGVVADDDGGELISIRMKNRGRIDRLAELRRLVDALREAPDPAVLYYEMLENTSPDSGVSGLGLARIRVEGRMDLSYEMRGDEVTVVAETRVLLEGVR